MFLTTENAGQYAGKTLDSTVRTFHYYPLRVVKHSNGRYYFVDRMDTMIPVHPAKDIFTAVYFDIVDGEVVDHGIEYTVPLLNPPLRSGVGPCDGKP